MLKIGEIAFLKGGVPVKIKEVLQLSSVTHYEIEVLQKIVGQDELEVPKKAGQEHASVNGSRTVGNNHIVGEEKVTGTKAKVSFDAPSSTQPPKKRLKSKFSGTEEYVPTLPKHPAPRQTLTSARAAAPIHDMKPKKSYGSGARSKASSLAVNPPQAQSSDHGSSDGNGNNVILSPWIHKPQAPGIAAKSTKSDAVPTIIGTQCSEEDHDGDYFPAESNKQQASNDHIRLAAAAQTADSNNTNHTNEHTIVRLSELPYYIIGKGKDVKNAPYMFCRICKTNKSSYGCLECSDENFVFTLHHPNHYPECLEQHMAVVTNSV